MTTYYADFVNGSDANNGLGPDASHATNKPWKTITKLLGAAGMTSGDTAHLAPVSFRETVAVAMTSAVAETKILGDPWNAQGFKTSGGVRVAPGPVIVTAYTTNDKTAPSSTTLLSLAARDFLTFRNILFMGGSNTTSSIITGTATTPTNIKFEDCAFIPFYTRQIIDATTTFGVPFSWLFDRCYFGPTNQGPAMRFNVPTGTGSDYDADIVFRNCIGVEAGQTFAQLTASGASANKGGGLLLRECTIIGSRAVTTVGSTSTSIPCQVVGCLIVALDNVGISAGTAGQVTEDYNVIYAGTPRSSVSAGANSIADGSYALLANIMGMDRIWGAPEPRPIGEPLAASPLLAFGSDGSATATDLVGLPRPATASLTAVGAFGTRHNTFTADPSPIGSGGAAALKITGPGDYGFRVPVTGGGNYTIEIDVQWDATYAGTKPQLRIDANPRVGVAAETITAAGSSGSPETLTLTTINPTGGGFDFVIVRVVSLDTNGAGVVRSDDLTVS